MVDGNMKKELTKEKTILFPIKPKQTQLCTYPLYRFLKRHELIFDFFFFGLNLATTLDRNRKIAATALAKVEVLDDNKRLQYDQIKDNEDFAIKKTSTIWIVSIRKHLHPNF